MHSDLKENMEGNMRGNMEGTMKGNMEGNMKGNIEGNKTLYNDAKLRLKVYSFDCDTDMLPGSHTHRKYMVCMV